MYELRLYNDWYKEAAVKVKNNEGKLVRRLGLRQVRELDKLIRGAEVIEDGEDYTRYRWEVKI